MLPCHASISKLIDLTHMILYTDCLDWRVTWMGWGLRMGFWQPSEGPEASHLLQKQQQIRKGIEMWCMHNNIYLFIISFCRSVSLYLRPQAPQPCCCRNHLVRWRSKSTGSLCWGQLLESTPCCRRAKAVPIGTWKSNSSGQTNDDSIYRIRRPVS